MINKIRETEALHCASSVLEHTSKEQLNNNYSHYFHWDAYKIIYPN